jgi:TetR/AcrR family hemagglutinin/protease transcriptional regulator
MARKPERKKERRQRMNRDLRREQLLDCAVRVVARNGLGSSPHAATAKEANVSVATVFAYFPTRSDLMRAVVQDVDRFYETLSRKAFSNNLGAAEAIIQLLDGCARAVTSDPDRTKISLDWSSSLGQEDLWPLFLEFHRRSVVRIATIIRRGQRDKEIPSSVNAAEAALIIASSGQTTLLMVLTQTPMKTIRHYQLELVHGALHLPPPPRHNPVVLPKRTSNGRARMLAT